MHPGSSEAFGLPEPACECQSQAMEQYMKNVVVGAGMIAAVSAAAAVSIATGIEPLAAIYILRRKR